MSPGSVERARRSAHPVAHLVTSLVVLVAILGGIFGGFLVLYKQFWGPTAFVERYIEKVAAADASGALAIPGVAPSFDQLEGVQRGLASETLLRAATLRSAITDVHGVSERAVDGDVTEVTVAYTIDGSEEQMTFRVAPAKRTGLAPAWRFETSPMSVVDLTVRGAWQFSVNGFTIDKRQISPLGLDADPLDPVSLLTFAPGNYDISVDTAATVAPPQVVKSTGALDVIPLDIQTRPTNELSDVVQSSVESFLDSTCTTQDVLQPSDCPFGFDATWGIAQDDVEWSIADYPTTALVPDGDDWRVSATTGTAHVNLTVQCFGGGYLAVDEDVHFTMIADVDVHDDGGVHITVDRDGEQPPTPNLCLG